MDTKNIRFKIFFNDLQYHLTTIKYSRISIYLEFEVYEWDMTYDIGSKARLVLRFIRYYNYYIGLCKTKYSTRAYFIKL